MISTEHSAKRVRCYRPLKSKIFNVIPISGTPSWSISSAISVLAPWWVLGQFDASNEAKNVWNFTAVQFGTKLFLKPSWRDVLPKHNFALENVILLKWSGRHHEEDCSWANHQEHRRRNVSGYSFSTLTTPLIRVRHAGSPFQGGELKPTP